jgi:hypothetical protein
VGGLKRASAAAGVVLIGAALFVGAAAAVAQEAPSTPLTVTKQGYFTNKITGALPPVLVKEVPPGPACIVVPQLCGPEVDALKTALSINDGVPLPDIPDYLVPQPVPPGELPVGMIGGANRYSSFLQFDLPKATPKSVVNRFDLVLPEGTIAFSIQSPAFRQAILTVLSQYPEQQPEVISKFIDDVTMQKTALATFEPTGIEACLVTAAWPGGDSQDPTTKPATDCIVGALGKHDAAAKTWTFDLSGIAQAWLDGKPNMGISLSPAGAQNVAYGDPDPSTNFILTLKPTPTARIDLGPPPVDIPLDIIPDTSTLGDTLDAGGAPSTDLGAISTGTGTVSTPSQAGSSAGTAKAKLASASASTPWWVWLIVPLLLGGCYALSQALDAVPDLAARRPGALSRLTAHMDSGS